MSARIMSIATVALAASAASAAVVDVYPADPSWSSSGNSGGGSSAITAGGPIEADGSIRLTGDRTRFGITPSVTIGGYGALSAVSTFKFNFATEQIGAGVVTAQAPALRLHVFEPSTNRQIQFVWEDGEQIPAQRQFVAGAGSLNTVYTGDFFGAANRVYPFTTGLGRGLFNGGGTLIGGTDSAQPLGNFLANLDPSTWVFQISVGVGSSVGSDYIGWADRVQFGLTGGPVTDYNFLVPAPGAAGVLALGGLLISRRRR